MGPKIIKSTQEGTRRTASGESLPEPDGSGSSQTYSGGSNLCLTCPSPSSKSGTQKKRGGRKKPGGSVEHRHCLGEERSEYPDGLSCRAAPEGYSKAQKALASPGPEEAIGVGLER
ncbi:unnamed protein product [Arctia plantaginis]|uniref:Uncharacterized protein n=1 Tax=Arctia plantaginis TaxID=874455 RepID=A0A8S1AHV8_ARCPL|nr:unnamed protein product [Arctia plantaginis]